MKISLSNSVEGLEEKRLTALMLPAFISFIFFLRQRQSSLVSQNGPKPIQLVVPSAVMAAVSMLTMNCRIVFQVFFFMKFEI